MSAKTAVIENLRRKGWTLVDAWQHALGSLQGKKLDALALVVLIGAKNRVGADYFQVFLGNVSGEVSHQPAVSGLYHQGRFPPYNWIEIASLSSRVDFDSGEQRLDVSPDGLAQRLLRYLAVLIPPGGHLMIEYDSPEQQDTARSLAQGIPPGATPLGYIMFAVGCGAGFRDWYFAEGGSEGPRKLQGFKPLDRRHAQLKTKEMVLELRAFLDRLPPGGGSELERAAQNRALDILNKLQRGRAKTKPWRYIPG